LSTPSNTIERDTRVDPDSGNPDSGNLDLGNPDLGNPVSSTDAQARTNAVQKILRAIEFLEDWQESPSDLKGQTETTIEDGPHSAQALSKPIP
jgi:hypothetical protein